MSDQEKVKAGYWSIAAQKHLKNFKADCTNMDELDTIHTAGKAGRLLGVIRGNSEMDNIKKLEKMAQSVGIGRQELHKVILPELEKASGGSVEVIRDINGDITRVNEYVFTHDNVLEISGQLFENLSPTDIEWASIETMDMTRRIPHYESELTQALVRAGFKEKDLLHAYNFQTQFGLMHKIERPRSSDPIYSNEYAWGKNHKKIAQAVADLSLGKRQSLKQVIDTIQECQGIPGEKLPVVDPNLTLLAKKVGMINPTVIRSLRGLEKEFNFSSNLFEMDEYNTDILDDIKLMVASIRFGQNYTQYSTIQDPHDFLSAFVRNKRIGPHTANGTDYTLLEERGIVKVERSQRYPSRYYMTLIREDVAKEALKVISTPYNLSMSVKPDANAIAECGVFKSPEECRLELGKAPEPVAEAMAHLTSVLRNETY